MRSRSAVLSAVVAIGVLGLISCDGDDEPEQATTDTGDIIRDVEIRLERRCQVAVLDVSLTRDAPVGLQFVGRVPFGRQRAIRLLGQGVVQPHSRELPLAAAPSGGVQAENGIVQRTMVWDLTYPNGDYLAPRTHRGRFRALNADRKKVLDTFPIELRIPKSFYKGSLADCGR